MSVVHSHIQPLAHARAHILLPACDYFHSEEAFAEGQHPGFRIAQTSETFDIAFGGMMNKFVGGRTVWIHHVPESWDVRELISCFGTVRDCSLNIGEFHSLLVEVHAPTGHTILPHDGYLACIVQCVYGPYYLITVNRGHKGLEIDAEPTDMGKSLQDPNAYFATPNQISTS